MTDQLDSSQREAVEAQRQRVLATERESADVGIITLRTAILVNAGAIVAFLAFVGQLWGTKNGALEAVLDNAHWFFWGLVLAILASLFAYLFTEMKLEREEGRYFAMLKGNNLLPLEDPEAEAKGADWFAVLLSALVLGSYGAFAVGSWFSLAALSH